MRRGEIYLVKRPGKRDLKRRRPFVVVSRQVLIDSAYASVICAPVYSSRIGLSSQVEIGVDEGMKQPCAVHCDGLVSVAKADLTDFLGLLDDQKLDELDRALRVALDLD